jgi:hypothetical protein
MQSGLFLEHTYCLAKHVLGWDKAALRHPGQVTRWTWLIIAAITQLRLARPLCTVIQDEDDGVMHGEDVRV